MRFLLSILLVFGIVAGISAAFHGPHRYYGWGYSRGWYGPCGPAAPWWAAPPAQAPAPGVPSPAPGVPAPGSQSPTPFVAPAPPTQ